MRTNTDQRYEWVSDLEDAQAKLREAFELISNYCSESGDTHTKAYIADHLRCLIDGEHSFLDNRTHLGRVIDNLLHPPDEYDEEDEEDAEEM